MRLDHARREADTVPDLGEGPMRRWLLAAVVAATPALVACGGATRVVTTTISVPLPPLVEVTTATVQVTPVMPQPPAGYRFGQVYTEPDLSTVAVLAYDRDYSDDTADAGTHDEAFQARFCSHAGGLLDFTVWSLIGADGSADTKILADSKAPTYPLDARLATGECVGGWLTFEVPDATHVVGVRYDDESQPSRPGLARWAVP